MDIERFMQGYKAAWEGRDKAQFCRLFARDGLYHNTPFAVQRGHEQLAAYWHRVELQEDVRLTYEVMASSPGAGIAHWHVTYRVASEELFRIWAASTGTHQIERKAAIRCPVSCSTACCRRASRTISARSAACGGTACRWRPDQGECRMPEESRRAAEGPGLRRFRYRGRLARQHRPRNRRHEIGR